MSQADDVGALLAQQFPGLRVTSTDRSPAKQRALIASGATRATNSQHLHGTGLDVVLPANVSNSAILSFLNGQGINPGEFIPESGRGAGQGTGAHLHIGLAPKAGRAKGGDQASTSDPAAQVRAWRQNREADVSRYPDIRTVVATRLTPATPIPPEVIAAYNSHKMSDADRATVDKYIADGTWHVPKGQRLQRPDPRTAGDYLGMGTRSIMEGAGGLADVVAGPLNAVANAAISPFTDKRLTTQPFRKAATSAADAMGLAKPESDSEQLNDAIIQGGTQGLVTAGGGMAAAGLNGATGAVGGALAANPILDTVSGAVSGASSETARQAGAGPVGQVVAGLAGGMLPVGLAAAGERAAANIRAPKSLPEVVEQTPRAAVIDDAGNLTPHGQEIAARHGATPEEVVQAYEAPPEVQDATANDQMPGAAAREATTGEPVAESAPTSQPEAGEPSQPITPTPEQPVAAPEPEAAPATARDRVQAANELGVDMTRGQATKNFDVQEAENRLRNSNGPEAEGMRQFAARQIEQVKTAVREFRSAFGDPDLTAEQRGTAVQDAVRELRDNGQKGVTALYKQARELGQNVPLETSGIRSAYDRLMVEADVPDGVKNVLTQEAARYGLIGKPAGTAENGITTVKIDDGAGGERSLKFYGPPETLGLDNAEAFRQVISKQYPADGGQKLTQILKTAIDDATEQAATKLAQYGQEGAEMPSALKAAREAHVEQVKTFKAKDIVQSIADWKKGTNTSALKPEQVMQQALAKTSDLKRIKAVLLSRPTVQSKAAWRAIQAHGLAEIFAKATQTNANVAGEVTNAISGAKLRSAIEDFGPDKLKVLLDPPEFGKLMKLRRVIEDVTIPVSGTTNPSGSGYLMMRLLGDVNRQTTAAFSAAGFAIGGPAGGALGGVVGRELGGAVKAGKEAKAAAETLKDVTDYTPERAATDTGKAPPSTIAKAGAAVKGAGMSTVKAFTNTYGSPRILAPILAASTGTER